jgi:hypothetical protein
MWATGVGEGRGGTAITNGEKLASVAQMAATVHSLMNRGHREKAKTMATSPEPFVQLGKVTSAVAAMADGENLAGARENGPRSHHSTQKMDGEKEERETKLTKRNHGAEAARGRQQTWWGRTTSPVVTMAQWGSFASKKWSGEGSRGRRRQGRALL